MLTRAIALMIIIGDSENLSGNKHWKRVIDYCESYGALIEAPLSEYE